MAKTVGFVGKRIVHTCSAIVQYTADEVKVTVERPLYGTIPVVNYFLPRCPHCGFRVYFN